MEPASRTILDYQAPSRRRRWLPAWDSWPVAILISILVLVVATTLYCWIVSELILPSPF